MRSDLSRGQLAAQLVHAIGESVSDTVPEGTYAIVLAVPNIKGLLEIRRALEDADISHKLICEPDSPFNGAPTCIGISPTTDRKRIRKVLGRLPLLK